MMKQFFSNYRPISLLPVISKILEKVISSQTYDFFQKEKHFYGSQYGFRNKHSTEFATLEIVNRLLTDMDNGETPINIFLYISKAFDTLNHEILLQKLNYYAVKDTSFKLFKNDLTNRKQYVDYNKVNSDMQNITTGVPQGSNLGPLLFIIYINDMSVVSRIFSFIMYADDTTLTSILKAFQPSPPMKSADMIVNNKLDNDNDNDNGNIVYLTKNNNTHKKYTIFVINKL